MVRYFVLFFFLFLAMNVDAQQRFRVYYLCIGSEHYEQDAKKFKEKKFIPYDNLPEAAASAVIMQRIFQQLGNARGITLLSSDHKMITKKAVLSGLDSLHRMVLADRATNVLLVLYYCGHGISENMSWNQFFVPGNYTYIAGTKKIDELENGLIHLATITDKLDGFKFNYLVLTDCCRKEEADNSLPEARLRYFFDEKNVEQFKSMVQVLKAFNEYRQANPVVFSIEPGNAAPIVDLPLSKFSYAYSPDTSLQVGPICRRMLLTLARADSLQKSITLEQMIQSLTSENLDAASPVSKCFYRREDNSHTGNVVLKW